MAKNISGDQSGTPGYESASGYFNDPSNALVSDSFHNEHDIGKVAFGLEKIKENFDAIASLGSSIGVSGTPVNDQLAVWVDSETLEGVSGLTYDGTDLTTTGKIFVGDGGIEFSGVTSMGIRRNSGSLVLSPDTGSGGWSVQSLTLIANNNSNVIYTGTGSASAPSYGFRSAVLGGFNSGFYHEGSGAIGVTNDGTQSASFTANGGLDLLSTDDTFRVNRLTTVQASALTKADGMVWYDTDLNKFQLRENGSDVEVGGGDFSNGGEAGGANRTLGNTDNFSLDFLVNNSKKFGIGANGAVFIGTQSVPSSDHALTINGDHGNSPMINISNTSSGDVGVLYNSGGSTFTLGLDESNSDFRLSTNPNLTGNWKLKINNTGQMVLGEASEAYGTSASLRLSKTAQAFITNKNTAVQEGIMTKEDGMMWYNTDTNKFVFRENGSDVNLGGGGGGDVSKVGTPVDNQVGVWTGDGTIEGTSGFTYSGTSLSITGKIDLGLGSSNGVYFGDGDSGIYELSDDILIVTGPVGTRIRASNANGFGLDVGDAASATNPTLMPSQVDTNTGIGWSAADTLEFITGGSSAATINSDGGLVLNSTTDVLRVNSLNSAQETALTPSNGNIWYQSDNSTFRFRASGTTYRFGEFCWVGAGNASSPSYSFANDPDTGMFSESTNVLGFSVQGTRQLSLNTVALQSFLPIRLPNGSSGSPSLSFSSDTDTGIRYSSSGRFAFVSNASTQLLIESGKLISNNVNGPAFLNEGASSTNPTLIPRVTDLNTGIGSNSNNQISLISSSVESFRVDNNSTSGETQCLIRDITAAVLKRISISSGTTADAGHKVLQVPA